MSTIGKNSIISKLHLGIKRRPNPVVHWWKERRIADEIKNSRFRQAILPHLDAAYNLARWLVRNEHDAQDLVQEACLRALTFFHTFHGEDGRNWLLAIVRNTCYTWLRRNRAQDLEPAKEPAAD